MPLIIELAAALLDSSCWKMHHQRMPRSSETSPDRNRVDVSDSADALLSWYVLAVGDSLSCASTLERIAMGFDGLYREQESKTAVVLQRLDTAHSLHCEVIVYFSPATTMLAHRFHATACSRPDFRGLTMLAGNAERWQDLFNET